MKKKYIKIISSCMLALCMTFAIAFTVLHTDANESNQIQYLERTYTTDNTAPETPEGYLFAGWYTDDNATTNDAVSNPELGKKYYAKFVPEEVLGIKAQISASILDGDTSDKENNAIRLVTSLDSTDYQHIGFNIQKGSGEAYDAETTKKVYKTLYAVGATEATEETKLTYKPNEEFHSASTYFKTWTIGKVPEGAFNTDITVTPYWITLDGTRVEGTTAIKTVNLGRSWVYVDSNANTDDKEYGTYEHPYTDFSKALDTIFIADKGKVIAKAGCNLENSASFEWNAHNMGMITVTAENTDSYIGFNVVPDMEINDDVTFENMKLQFATKVYANGHYFKVAETVNLVNDDTTLSGGGKTASVDSTNLEIYAGSWKVIYGSSEKVAGSVEGDTHITIGGNTQIRHASSGYQNMVFGGGYSDVGGNTYVTIGGTFNSGLDLSNHDALSVVYGGGRGTGTVSKDTNVIIQDNAKATYVYGGGGAGTKVLGTCHVIMNNGDVMSINGGGASGDNTEAKQNADTSVIVKGGTVEQVFGGNASGMTGNTYVELSGGTVKRRVSGGCYNDGTTNYVKGYTTVVIKDGAVFNNQYSEDINAESFLTTKQDDEHGVLIFNDALYDSFTGKINRYDYLVKANNGGDVTVTTSVVADKAMLSITPDDAGTPGTVTSGTSTTYFKGAGVCELPTTTGTTDIDFSPDNIESELANCEARIDGIYYDTFVNAVNSAKTRKNNPTVTVMKDCTVNTAIANVAGEEYTIVGDGDAGKTITVDSAVSELIQVKGKLTLENLKFTGGNSIVRNYSGTLTLNNIEMNAIAGVGIWHSNGTTYAYNTTISEVVKFGIFVQNGTANIDNVKISDITGTDNRDAINVQGGKLNIYNTQDPNNGVTISNVAQRDGIHVEAGEVYADAVTITDIKTGHGIYVHNGKVDINQLTVGSDEGPITGAALYMTKEYQAKASIDHFTASHIGAQVVYLEGNTSAEITNFNLTSSTDTGVRTKGTASVILENGTITAANGRYGVYADGTSTVTATDVSIVRNVAMASGVNSLVYVGSGSTITLKENDGTSMIQGNSELAGKGVVVDGTFNLEGGTITGHKLASTSNKGAGVHVQAGGVFNMSGGSVTGNTAVNGGGVALVGTAADNEAGTEAVLATFNLTGGKIAENVATATASDTTTGAGGGIYATYASITMDGQSTEISKNTGINDGAGVLLSTGATFTMNNGKITGNTMENGKAARGGGVAIINDGSFTLEDGEVSGNVGRAGGGFILKNSAHLIINGGSIKSNKAININGSAGYGGAIYILDTAAQVTMNKGTIDLNTSMNAGGSMYMNKGTFNWNGGTFGTQTKGSVTGSNTSNCKANVSSTITDYSIINSEKVSINVINN